MRIQKRTLALIAIPAAAIAWAAFRPELLFVDQKANDTAPVATQLTTLSSGDFTGYAHETTGKATLLKADGKTILRLTGFATSNGPDVRVYLVKGAKSDKEGVEKNGYLDLGTIKGNKGDQNYTLPAGTNLGEYGAVAIWCKRFAVDFGGTTLVKPVAATLGTERATNSFGATVSFASFGADVTVTSGKFGGKMGGTAAIIETNGKRFLQIIGAKAPAGTRVLLLKAETVTSAGVSKVPKIDLGALRVGGRAQSFPIDREVDAWLYRNVSLWSGGKSFAIAPLRSAQERAPKLQQL